MTTKSQAVLNWIDERFPLTSSIKGHLTEYYAPKNFNFWYFFGSLALLVLVIQILTGIFLVMHYKPDASLNAAGVPVAFASVEYIMREVPGGWLIRYLHSTGASAFFVVVYLHMFRGLLYGSYRKPRELIWIFGTLIFLVLMAEAFMGYLLPWGQMSFWGAQVIRNLFSAIPVIGPDLSLVIRGDFVVSDATLNRFFSFHVIAVPLVLIGLVAAHIIALHEVGSNNPDGVEIKKKKDANGIPLDGIPSTRTTRSRTSLASWPSCSSSARWCSSRRKRRVLPRVQQLPACRPADDAASHCAGVVFHPLLFRPACGHLSAVRSGCEVLGCRGHGRVGGDHRLPALAGPQPGEVDPLQGSDLQDRAGHLRHLLLHPGLPGRAAPDPGRTLVSQICSVLYFAFFLLMPWYSKLDKCKAEPERVNFK